MNRRSLDLPFFFVVFTPVILFSPIIFTGKALFWGVPSTQFIPWWSLAWEYVRAGSAPLWNPYSGMGAPLLANYQSAIFYPPHWFYLLMDSIGGITWMAWTQAILVTIHLIWAGIGMVIFIRRLGLNEVAQIIGGLAYGMSGYLVARAGFFSINASAAWLPWMMVAVTDISEIYINDGKYSISDGGSHQRKLVRSIKFKRHSIFSIYLGLLLLSGHAQTTWYILIFVSSWCVYLFVSSDRARILRTAAPTLIVAACFGVLLSAIQLLPTAEYLFQSQRASAVDYELAMSYSFWPWHFLTFLAPGLFGNPVQGNYWGYGNYWEDAVYIGLLPFILAVSGILLWVRDKVRGLRSSIKVFFITVIVVVPILALGRNTSIFPWLYKNIPTFDMFQAPTRLMILVVFSLAVLAAYSADGWRRPYGRALYWTRLSLMGSIAIVAGSAMASWLFRFLDINVEPSITTATLLTGILAFGSVLLTLFAPGTSNNKKAKSKLSGFWNWAVGIFVAGDLLIAGWGLNPGVSVDFYKFEGLRESLKQSAYSDGRIYLSRTDEEYLKFDRFFRFDTFNPFTEGGSWIALRESLLPNLNVIDRIPSANNFDPLVPSRYAKWMATVESSSGERKENLLRVMNVSIIEQVDKNSNGDLKFIPSTSFRRIRWVPCSIRVNSGEEALRIITDSDVDFEAKVILEGEPTQTDDSCKGDDDTKLVELRNDPRNMKLEVEAKQDGYLFIADTWYPGWKAYLDGEKVEILRANYLFKAIPVRAGHHEVEMVYKPGLYYLGATLSGAAWIVLISVMLFLVRHGNIQT